MNERKKNLQLESQIKINKDSGWRNEILEKENKNKI
jgi:hypothetical protein